MRDNGRFSYDNNGNNTMNNNMRRRSYPFNPNQRNAPSQDNSGAEERQLTTQDRSCMNTSRTNRYNNRMKTDFGPDPYVVDIADATMRNDNFRTALWTGEHLQLTVMCIKEGEDIGLECHPELDQFVCIEEGRGVVVMGESKNRFDFKANVFDGFAFMIPAGTWHNLINTGGKPLKLFSLYAPPQHPRGTVQETKEEAAEEEHED